MKTINERLAERATWTDERLTMDLANAASRERSSLVELLLDLIEFDHRSLSQKGAYHTLFDYCTRKLGYSSSEAGRRIAVARNGEKFPLLLEMIDRGKLHLSGAGMLAGLLTADNHAEVLKRANGRTQEEIGRIAAALAPKPSPMDRIRVVSVPLAAVELSVPAASPPALLSQDAPRDNATEMKPVEATYAVTFAATQETHDRLQRAQELLRHRFPRGDLDRIFNLALKTLLDGLDRDLRKPAKPRARKAASRRSRHIPETVKQRSWERAGGQCAFVAEDGTRCASRAWLEFDRATPYALGGSSVDPSNIRLYCRSHNAWASRQIFGPWTGGKMKPQNTS